MPPYRGDGLGLCAFCPCCPSRCNFLRRLHCHSSHCQGGVQVRPFGATCDPIAHRFWQALRLGSIRYLFLQADGQAPPFCLALRRWDPGSDLSVVGLFGFGLFSGGLGCLFALGFGAVVGCAFRSLLGSYPGLYYS